MNVKPTQYLVGLGVAVVIAIPPYLFLTRDTEQHNRGQYVHVKYNCIYEDSANFPAEAKEQCQKAKQTK